MAGRPTAARLLMAVRLPVEALRLVAVQLLVAVS